MPPPDECVPNTMAPPEIRRIAPLMDRFDMRFHPDHVGWASVQPSGSGSSAPGSGWSTAASPTRSRC